MSAPFCPLCKKQCSNVTPRYVATKKTVLNICDVCIMKHVTYAPNVVIPDGDSLICQTT